MTQIDTNIIKDNYNNKDNINYQLSIINYQNPLKC